MKYKYLLFDADNTLFDFDLSEKLAFLSLDSVSPGSFPEANYELYHKINNAQWRQLEKGLTTKEKLKIDRFYEYYKAIGIAPSEALVSESANVYLTSLGKENNLIEGAIKTLEYLSERYEIYIITNGIATVQRSRLNSSQIKNYVKQVFISEEIGYDKPDSRYFQRVIDTIGDPIKSHYLVIGDSLSSDINGAVNFELDCVYFDRHLTANCTSPAKYTISSLTDLISIL